MVQDRNPMFRRLTPGRDLVITVASTQVAIEDIASGLEDLGATDH
jgi:hypothetical protein